MRPAHALASSLMIGLACTPLLAQDYRAAIDATVSAIRDGGTVLTSWAVAQAGGPKASQDDIASPAELDWNACPRITFEKARSLAGAEQEKHLRQRDGWGHEIEYCLRADDPAAARYVVGLRSPGRDGKFDTTSYLPGLFDRSQPDHDVVWIDGVFVTAPRPR